MYIGFAVIFVMSQIAQAARRRRLKKALKYEPPNIHGAAAWATEQSIRLAGLFKKKKGGIFLAHFRAGRWRRLKPLYFHGKKTNLITFGSTGDGKTATLLAAELTWPYSLIVIDPQGEHLAVGGKYRRKFGRVFQFNQSHQFERETRGIPYMTYNPMGRHWLIPQDKRTFGSRGAKISEAGVREAWGEKTPYWFSTSRTLLLFFVLFWAKFGKPHERNLPYIARLISSSEIEDCMRWMMRRADDQYIRHIGARFVSKGADSIKSLQEVRENLRSEIAFALEPTIAETLMESNVTPSHCKREVTTIYIVGSGAEETDGRLARFALVCSLGELLRPDAKGSVRTLIIADEYYSLRYRDGDHAFATCRKYDVQMWVCLQTMDMLRALNPITYESYLNNAGVVQWVSAADIQGSEYVSRLAGDSEVYGYSKSVNTEFDRGDVHISDSVGQQARRLILPHEVRELTENGGNEQILRVRGVKGLIRAVSKPYWETGLKKRAQKNPFYRKQGLWKKIWR